MDKEPGYQKNLDWLAQLPLTAIVGSIQIVHGSPVNPIWDYVLDPLTAHDIMTLMEEDFCLVGHTHQPMVFNFNAQMSHPSWSIPHPGKPSRLVPRMMLNPGSIGQPRDRDPRSSYIILETDTMEFTQYRLEYDVQKTQQDMLSRNLPARMAHRLREGW